MFKLIRNNIRFNQKFKKKWGIIKKEIKVYKKKMKITKRYEK